MLAHVTTAALHGVEAYLVRVEVDVASGLPAFQTVGLPTEAVRESRDRVLSALRNTGFPLAPSRVTVNLAPADLRKAGAAFDLPIALGLLAATEQLAQEALHERLVLGELGLDGRLQPVTGVLPMALAARRSGVAEVVVPAVNAREAALVEGLEVRGMETISEVVDFLMGRAVRVAAGGNGSRDGEAPARSDPVRVPDLAEVRGQESAKRALEVAAAGGHNVLLVGPPGAGKTMLARRVPSILPALTLEEAIEVTSIHSAAGALRRADALVWVPPFRAPHHTTSYAGLVGGGAVPHPGEVSLAHRGVLFLDELPEFKRHVLESLRQPLEEGEVTLVRASWKASFPARFMLVAAMNPCPCGGGNGRGGRSAAGCRCAPEAIERYRGRLSGPLLDRIDIQVMLPAVRFEELSATAEEEPSLAVLARVLGARARQRERGEEAALRAPQDTERRGASPAFLNAQLTPQAMKRWCELDASGMRLLRASMEKLGLSARAYHRILRVARTITDLEGETRIASHHVAEAVHYRALDRRG